MKIVIVSTSDVVGGAARAAYRLHQALIKQDVNSTMLVQHKTIDDSTIIGSNTKLQKAVEKIRPALDSLPLKNYKNKSKTLFSPGWLPLSGIVDRINELNPDIVHLHWVSGGLLRIEDIPLIKAPIVWSLHDMWTFSGGCHYDEGCNGYRDECGNCKVLNSNTKKDLSNRVYNRKRIALNQKKNITLVGLSGWIYKEASQSSLFSDRCIVNLPNPIDCNKFAPFEKSSARKLFNLPHDKKLILFGAMGATSDPRKGYKELINALNIISSKDVALVVFGANEPENGTNFPQPAYYLGHLYDDVTLRLLYSAADVMVVPSLQENLSNAIMESLACGTSVVGFNIGGNKDLVDHFKNGYLARELDVKDLAYGIDWVLQHPEPEILAVSARDKVVKNFEQNYVAKQYIGLYKKCLGRK